MASSYQDECSTGTHSCSELATCRDTIDSFVCICKPGYQSSDDGVTCSDIDECSEGSHTCYTGTTCINERGGFNCTCNPLQTTPAPVTCRYLATRTCYSESSPQLYTSCCVDGLYCARITDVSNNAYYRCETIGVCPTGFTCSQAEYPFDPCFNDNTQCEEDDASADWNCTCNTNNVKICRHVTDCGVDDTCDVNAHCTETTGSFRCTCKTGYSSSGTGIASTCSDIDECSLGYDNCDSRNSNCSNTAGSFVCACNTGYLTADSAVTCTDLDECATEQNNTCDLSSGACFNVNGSFVCTCNAGYGTVDFGMNCADVDECLLETDDCDARLSSCRNNFGSFECECVVGFNTSDRGVSCLDIDECLRDQDNTCTDENAGCHNTNGSFTCQCNQGYSSSDGGMTCYDVDECGLGSDGCDRAHAECFNMPGSYEC
eukprot:2836987-Rhodomonas_salina.1